MKKLIEFPLNITSTPILRILTKKSILTFGKYNRESVAKIISINPYYLRWVYYNINGISFSTDVLQEIHLPEIINKPGIKPEAITFTKNKYTTKKTWLEKIKPCRKLQLDHIKCQISISQNKGSLQRYNQGHR